MRDRESESVSDRLLDLLRHFPQVFNSWLFFLQQTDPNRLLSVVNTLGRCDEVVHLLLQHAYDELDLTKRKAALTSVQRVVTTAVSAGRKDMQFYGDVRVSRESEM